MLSFFYVYCILSLYRKSLPYRQLPNVLIAPTPTIRISGFFNVAALCTMQQLSVLVPNAWLSLKFVDQYFNSLRAVYNNKPYQVQKGGFCRNWNLSFFLQLDLKLLSPPFLGMWSFLGVERPQGQYQGPRLLLHAVWFYASGRLLMLHNVGSGHRRQPYR